MLSPLAGGARCAAVMVDSTGSECTLSVNNWRGSDLDVFKARIAEVKLAEAKQTFEARMLEAYKPGYGTNHNTVNHLQLL